ncbi:hypothetical protein RV134_250122 [Roseovarius sp. EC-HK134]|nr:hypothetical protein RV420_280102 [Roseovarius sp. EC-SD190]VVT05789.1 hypothetical protein RV134_250122 [Roseovarius sp. EC-HK134]
MGRQGSSWSFHVLSLKYRLTHDPMKPLRAKGVCLFFKLSILSFIYIILAHYLSRISL